MESSTVKSQPRSKRNWEYEAAAREFRKRHGSPAYTMYPNETLEREMRDAALDLAVRVLACIRRYAWGHFADWAVDRMPPREGKPDPKPRPLTQEDVSRLVSGSPKRVSEAIRQLKGFGYLRKDHQFLYPEEKIDPLESTNFRGVDPDPPDSHSPYLRFKTWRLNENPDMGKTLAEWSDKHKRAHAEKLAAHREMKKIELLLLKEWDAYLEQGDSMCFCANAQDEDESKANCTSVNKIGVDPDPSEKKSGGSKPEIRGVPDSKPRNPHIPKKRSAEPIKDKLLMAKGQMAAAAPSTVVEPETKAAPTPPPPPPPDFALSPETFHNHLTQIFATAGKSVPLHSQSDAALSRLNGSAPRFLEGLPLTRLFQTCQGGQNLRFQVDTFLAEEKAAGHRPHPVQPEPQNITPPKWPGQGTWAADKDHWEELSPDMQEFYSELFPELFTFIPREEAK